LPSYAAHLLQQQYNHDNNKSIGRNARWSRAGFSHRNTQATSSQQRASFSHESSRCSGTAAALLRDRQTDEQSDRHRLMLYALGFMFYAMDGASVISARTLSISVETFVG